MQLGSHGAVADGGSGLGGLILGKHGSHGRLKHGSRAADLDRGLLQVPRGLAASRQPYPFQ